MNTEIIREEFTAWMRREMPANTIIGDPDWWARKILGTIGALDAKAEQQAEKVPEGMTLVPSTYIEAVEKEIIFVCCQAVEKLNEIAPKTGWDAGEVVAEPHNIKLRSMLSGTKEQP